MLLGGLTVYLPTWAYQAFITQTALLYCFFVNMNFPIMIDTFSIKVDFCICVCDFDCRETLHELRKLPPDEPNHIDSRKQECSHLKCPPPTSVYQGCHKPHPSIPGYNFLLDSRCPPSPFHSSSPIAVLPTSISMGLFQGQVPYLSRQLCVFLTIRHVWNSATTFFEIPCFLLYATDMSIVSQLHLFAQIVQFLLCHLENCGPL